MTKTDSILALAKVGKTPNEIYHELGIRRSSVHLVLLKYGLIRGKPSILPKKIQKEITQKYNTGASIREICKLFAISRFQAETVLNHILRNHADSNHMRGVRLAPEITDSQKQILLGTLLGDASISRNSNRGYHVRVSHSSIYREYAEYKSLLLNGGPVHDYKTGSSWSTNPLSTFVVKNARTSKYLENIVLVDRKKYVNEKWTSRLTVEAIAYWFMDDGSSSFRKYGVNVAFATNGFDEVENILLQVRLNELGFETLLNRPPSGTGTRFTLRLRANSTDKFMDSINQYVNPVKCMRYKLKYR